mmetsp:Transcript_111784/g.194009  ORF Transcript_111784/g.194009 Transcript_111784/m.194009 type:complete len:179 (-) Transcript_111784:374-910(-)
MIRHWDGENFVEKENVHGLSEEDKRSKGPVTLEEARQKYITGYAKLQYDHDTVQKGMDRFKLKKEQRIFENEREKQELARAQQPMATPFDILLDTSTTTSIGPTQPIVPSGMLLKKKKKKERPSEGKDEAGKAKAAAAPGGGKAPEAEKEKRPGGKPVISEWESEPEPKRRKASVVGY